MRPNDSWNSSGPGSGLRQTFPICDRITEVIEPPDEHTGIESEVTVTIAQDRGGAELVIRHEKLARIDALMRHDGGWRGALEQLAAMLERSATEAAAIGS